MSSAYADDILYDVPKQALLFSTRATDQRIFLRSEPSFSSKSLGSVRIGDQPEALAEVKREERRPWYQLRFSDGRIGWIYGQYVQLANGAVSTALAPAVAVSEPAVAAEPTSSAPAAGYPKVGRVNASTLTIRQTPSRTARSLGELQRGARIDLLDETTLGDGRWIRVSASGGEGWVFARYVTVVSADRPTEPSTDRSIETPTEPSVETPAVSSVDSTADVVASVEPTPAAPEPTPSVIPVVLPEPAPPPPVLTPDAVAVAASEPTVAAEPTSSAPAAGYPKIGRVNASTLTIRQSPSRAARSLGELQRGARIDLLDETTLGDGR